MSEQPNQQPQETDQPEKISKKQQKKLEKEKEKEQKKEAQKQTQQQQVQEEEDPLKHNYGDYELIQSQEKTSRVWTQVKNIDETIVPHKILVRARLHNSRVKGNLAFLVLREQFATIQAVASKGEFVSKQMLKFIAGIPSESIIDVVAVVKKPEQEIKTCSQKVELIIEQVFVVSRSVPQLPFQIEDAQRQLKKGENEDELTEEEKKALELEKDQKVAPRVLMKTRLDNRIIDLRTVAKQAIFIIQSGVCQLFREFLYQNSFIEIHTPKLIGGTSEGGSNVFRLKYFNKEACLAQSPQLYKQMCVMSDFDRVFEIGPVFRAENSFTHRHMCEFTGLDIEMGIKENYHELLDIMASLFDYIFTGIAQRYPREMQAINDQFPFEPFQNANPTVKLTFQEGVQLLAEKGVKIDPLDDLSTETERILGQIVKEKYNTDFYMLHRYPKNARPFYTMICKDDSNYTNSYDFFMRGEEITSGAQRIHCPNLLEQRAKECGIGVETIRDYINSFKYGAFPHGGCGIGLERVVMLYFGLGNIRNSSMFPRDPMRITP